MATGVFHAARSGQSMQYRARVRRARALERFAEAISHWDAETGDPGGNVRKVSEKLGMSPSAGHAMMQRLRRDLGPQAS